jgi:hypothetical protein
MKTARQWCYPELHKLSICPPIPQFSQPFQYSPLYYNVFQVSASRLPTTAVCAFPYCLTRATYPTLTIISVRALVPL